VIFILFKYQNVFSVLFVVNVFFRFIQKKNQAMKKGKGKSAVFFHDSLLVPQD